LVYKEIMAKKWTTDLGVFLLGICSGLIIALIIASSYNKAQTKQNSQDYRAAQIPFTQTP
jgi:hypothetical protein